VDEGVVDEGVHDAPDPSAVGEHGDGLGLDGDPPARVSLLEPQHDLARDGVEAEGLADELGTVEPVHRDDLPDAAREDLALPVDGGEELELQVLLQPVPPGAERLRVAVDGGDRRRQAVGDEGDELVPCAVERGAGLEALALGADALGEVGDDAGEHLGGEDDLPGDDAGEARPQARRVVGLHEVAVGAGGEHRGDGGDVGGGGEGDDAGVRQRAADRLRHLRAHGGREVHVEQDEVGLVLGGRGDRGVGAVRLAADLEAEPDLEDPAQRGADRRVVVHDEDPHARRPAGAASGVASRCAAAA
jgi:hypothetical protein